MEAGMSLHGLIKFLLSPLEIEISTFQQKPVGVDWSYDRLYN